MKKLLLIMLVLISTLSFSANKTTKANGNWSSVSTWNGGVPANGDNITINHNVIINQTVIVNNLTISPTKTLTNGAFVLQVTGNWINNGSFIDNSGQVYFKGVTQTLKGKTTFYNLRVRPTNKISVFDSIWVTNLLRLNSGDLDVSTSMLTIVGDVIHNGRLDAISNGANIIGSFIFQKWVDRCNNWSLYGGPFASTLNNYADSATGQMIYTGFPNSDFPTFGSGNAYLWNENTTSGGWVLPDGNNILPRGSGFWYWNSDTVFNTLSPSIIQKWKVVTKGTIDFTATFSFPIQYTNNGNISNDGWNLVSNPYPGTIDWDATGWVKMNVDNAIYIYNTCTQSYMSYVGGIGVNGGSRYVSTFQGFYIKTRGTSPLLSSNRRVIKNNIVSLQKTTNLQSNVLRIELGGDEIVLRENDLSDSLFNSDYDAYKFMDNASLYSKNSGSDLYSINTVDSTTSKIPLYTLGNGTLNFSDMTTWEPTYDLWLEDLKLGTFTSLNIITSYTFTSTIPSGTYTNRFIIHLHNPNISVGIYDQVNKKEKTLINIINIIGQDIDIKTYKGIVIYRYSDGSSEKKMNIINL